MLNLTLRASTRPFPSWPIHHIALPLPRSLEVELIFQGQQHQRVSRTKDDISKETIHHKVQDVLCIGWVVEINNIDETLDGRCSLDEGDGGGGGQTGFEEVADLWERGEVVEVEVWGLEALTLAVAVIIALLGLAVFVIVIALLVTLVALLAVCNATFDLLECAKVSMSKARIE